MRKIIITFIMFSALALSAEESEGLEFLGRTVIYENGSWVNPEEPKFKLKSPKTWVKRNYVRHYMQGSEEITSSVLEINWKGLSEAAKTGNKIPMKEFIKVFQGNPLKPAKEHPEAVIVPVGFAAGSAMEGGKATVMATAGLLKNAGEISLKLIKFVSSPIRRVIPKRQKMELRNDK